MWNAKISRRHSVRLEWEKKAMDNNYCPIATGYPRSNTRRLHKDKEKIPLLWVPQLALLQYGARLHLVRK